MKVNTRLQLLCALLMAIPGSRAVMAAETPEELFVANRFAQARSAYQQSVKHDPQQIGVRIGLIRTLFRLDQWQDADTEARRLAMIAPDNGDAHGMLSLCYMRQGLPEKAAEEAKRALELNPASYWGLVAMGRTQLWDDQREAAQATLRRAVALHSDWPEAWYVLVMASADTVTEQNLADSVSYVHLTPKGHPHEFMMETLPIHLDFLRQFLRDQPYSAVSPITEEHLMAAERGDEKDFALTIPIERQDKSVILPIKVNQQEFHVLFDTGGGFEMTLDKSAAARLKLPVLYKSLVRGVSGAEPSQLYKASRMQMGDQIFQSIPIEGINNKVGPFDGIFGVTNFDHYAVTIDFVRNQLTLARGKHASAPAPAIGNRQLTLPFHYFGGDIFVPVTVEGRRVWAIVDTGADAYAVLSLRLARAIAVSRGKGASQETHLNGRMGIGTSSTRQTMLLFQDPVSMVIGDTAGQALHTSINPAYGASPLDEQVSPSGDFEVGALLGISFLSSARRITFDYPHRLLTLELPADKLTGTSP